ncbi:MAG TPA: hypothetical protein VGQ68_02130 [Gaiellaceae bacterium]|jgi:hypothetical protein|nr:hypothetical protein [Gaiellaceae bacterium]
MAYDQGHILFVSKPTGYELVERGGEPPAIGSTVELDGQEGHWIVSRISLSPLPQDRRPCAYLQQTPD